MRKILFRGKRLDNSEWIYGGYHYEHGFSKDNEKHYITVYETFGAFTYNSFVEVDSTTIGQFTGLLDKNGNKIFEGDIVKSKYNQTTEIKFGEFVDTKSHEQVGFYQVYFIDDDWYGFNHGNMDYVKDSEIIGNIHENSELYKEIKGEIK